jgi:hypothetical protein
MYFGEVHFGNERWMQVAQNSVLGRASVFVALNFQVLLTEGWLVRSFFFSSLSYFQCQKLEKKTIHIERDMNICAEWYANIQTLYET